MISSGEWLMRELGKLLLLLEFISEIRTDRNKPFNAKLKLLTVIQRSAKK